MNSNTKGKTFIPDLQAINISEELLLNRCKASNKRRSRIISGDSRMSYVPRKKRYPQRVLSLTGISLMKRRSYSVSDLDPTNLDQ